MLLNSFEISNGCKVSADHKVDVLTPKILAVQNHDPFVDIQIHSNEYHLR